MIKNRVQIQNPKSGRWKLIDKEKGLIIGDKRTPYKNIEKVGDDHN